MCVLFSNDTCARPSSSVLHRFFQFFSVFHFSLSRWTSTQHLLLFLNQFATKPQYNTLKEIEKLFRVLNLKSVKTKQNETKRKNEEPYYVSRFSFLHFRISVWQLRQSRQGDESNLQVQGGRS
jgi:hypothetical protein